MAPAPGASEKEQGNVHFKAGRYAQAVGAYSAAIAADRQNSTYLLNRSQAYLKLSKWEDALRDASSCLTLDPKSTKALFRRAAAHKGLERFVEALNDLKKAKSLDGRNPEIDAEISAVQSLLEKQVQQEQARKAKREALVRRNLESTQETQPYPSPQGSSTALAKVRESLKEPSSKGNEDNMIKAVSTRRFDNSSAPLQSASAPVAQNSHPVSQALSKPMTFAEAKQARAQRLGGQQPRHSTAASTAVQSSLDKATAPSPEHALSSPKLQSASIKSAYEFTRAWREAAGCSTQSLQEARRDILKVGFIQSVLV